MPDDHVEKWLRNYRIEQGKQRNRGKRARVNQNATVLADQIRRRYVNTQTEEAIINSFITQGLKNAP